MSEFKKLLACVVAVGVAGVFVGCEQDSDLNTGPDQECDDAGHCVDITDAGMGGGDGAGGGGGADGVAPVIQNDWNTIHIMDISNADKASTKGTPGVDVCGVSFDCGARGTGNGVETQFEKGEGVICTEGQSVGGSDCSATRSLKAAAEGPIENPCEAGSAPSHYVALGVGGTLKVRVDTAAADLVAGGGLAGCTITVAELPPSGADANEEAYQVLVCSGWDLDDNCFPFDAAYDVEAPGGEGTLDIVPLP